MSKMLLLRECGAQVEGFCLVKSASVRTDSKGGVYVDFVLSDAGGECVAKLWNYSPQSHGRFDTDDVIKVRGTINIYKDTEQLKIEKIRPANEGDEIDMSRLVPCAPIDPEEIYDRLYKQAESFRDNDLAKLVTRLMDENKQKLLYFPAAVKLHHAYRSGLLHHTWSVCRLALSIANLYPKLNKELLTAGAILHDIGKIYEMDTGRLGLAGAYTAEGQLVGHIQLGIDMLRRTADELNTPEETVLMLEHMLLSHHGQPDFGSPKYPMFPEAEILSQSDLIDARLFEMYDVLSSVAPGGFSERVWSLDNRMLYRARNSGSEE